MRFLILLLNALMAMPALAQDVPRLGIFGLVEAISPLVVAGQEIALPKGLPVISPLGLGQAIGVGDTLAIRVNVDNGKLTAMRVLHVHPVVGPVATVQDKIATIMGSPIHVPPDKDLKSGDWVAVSGFWSGGTVITTKLREVSRSSFAHLTGAVSSDGFKLGGSEVRGAQVPLEGFGDHIWMLSGAPEVSGLRVRLISKGIFGGEIDLAVWQGHASLPIASQTYMIHGTGLIGTARDAQMPEAGALIIRCASEGRILNRAPDGMKAAYSALGCSKHTPGD